jgi:hypothetical protein
MSCIGYGKTAEGILITPAFLSERISSATVYYSGVPLTDASDFGFDTQPFDDCLCAINVGTFNSLDSLGTLINDIYESDTNDPSAATILSGASFPDLKSATDEALRQGSILCKDTKRFLFLRTETQGEEITCDMGAFWVGGTPRSQETPMSLQFDV